MGLLVFSVFATFAACSCYPLSELNGNVNSYSLQVVSRDQWGARPPRLPLTVLATPVSLVVIHHTFVPDVCTTSAECQQAMRSMQTFHQDTNGWTDIGYNFAVGGDGRVYTGRGWQAVGAHAAGVNSRSIGIVLIGDFVSKLPSALQLQSAKDLIALGVNLGFISPNYELIGHRQVSATECPGQALFQEISTWDHFTNKEQPLKYYARQDWGAVPATDTRPLNTPVPYVVIHHTYIPAACNTTQQCMKSMRSMQNYHNSLDWGDIGYNFCVGSEGGVYEGRGWKTVGIHAGRANSISVGICLIGDWQNELPPFIQLEATAALIEDGVKDGHISPDYKLIGHRQAMATECPGGALYKEISTWEHFSPVFELKKQ